MSEGGIHIEVTSGVSIFTGEAFCSIVVRGARGEVLGTGQDAPAGVRTMALGWLEAAEAAESDAAVFAELKEMGVAEPARACFIASLRKRRS